MNDHCYECETHKQFVKELLKSVKPCDGFVHKFSCGAGCRKYVCKINDKTNTKEHYCFGRRVSSKAIDWLKVVGCGSFKNGSDTDNTE